MSLARRETSPTEEDRANGDYRLGRREQGRSLAMEAEEPPRV